jgi:uncharacterized BrkB/YihY/UPF0761 family membrane protein
VNSKLRLFAALALSGLAGLLSFLGILLPIHEYDWADEPEMKELLNPDAILTVIVLCVLGFLAASASIILLRRLERSRVLRWVFLGTAGLALVLCTYRLLEVLPMYAG